MQEGEAGESHALFSAERLCLELQKPGRAHRASKAAKPSHNLHRRDQLYEEVTQTQGVVDEEF